MSQLEKLIARLRSRPSDFKYDELRTLFSKLGYAEDTKGKTTGSHTGFYKLGDKNIAIDLYKPHSTKNYIDKYLIKDIIDFLEENGDI